jgi:hypothetical protein
VVHAQSLAGWQVCEKLQSMTSSPSTDQPTQPSTEPQERGEAVVDLNSRCRECSEPLDAGEPWLHAGCSDEREDNASNGTEEENFTIKELAMNNVGLVAQAHKLETQLKAAQEEIEELKESLAEGNAHFNEVVERKMTVLRAQLDKQP